MFAALFLELEEELFTEASEETEELIEETLEETEDIWEETEEAEDESAETEEPATLVAETKLDSVATEEELMFDSCVIECVCFVEILKVV